jgi:hypothetical protein
MSSTSFHLTLLLRKHALLVALQHHPHRRRLMIRINQNGRIFLMVNGFNSTTFLTIVMVQMTKILTPLLMIGISNCSPVGLKSGTFHHGRRNLLPTSTAGRSLV